ncbi:MAG: caspase family protein [Flavobacteriaceae bacterium]
MRRFPLFIVSLLVSLCMQAQQEFVVQSTHAQNVSYSALDTKNGVLVTYGYADKTLKFWNEQTGLLYRTIDLDNYNNDLEVNSRDGKTYILTKNTIVVYSNETFEVIGNYPLGRIYAMDYVDTPEFHALTFFAQDTQGNQALYSLDENSETFNSGKIAPFPGEGNINHFEFNSTLSHLLILTDYFENYVYDFLNGTYHELKGYCVAIMENGDVIKAVYDQDNGLATFIRLNPKTQAEVWRHTVPLQGVVGEAIPFRGDAVVNDNGTTLWLAPGTGALTEVDAKTGTVLGKIDRKEEKIALLPHGKWLYAQVGYDTPYGKYKRYDSIPTVTYGKSLLNPTRLTLYAGQDELELLFSAKYANHQTFSLYSGPNATRFTNYHTNYRDDYSDGTMVPDPTSSKVLAITANTDPIKIFERGKPDSFSDLIENYGEVNGFDFNSKSHLLALFSKGGMRIIDTEEGTEVFSKMIAGEPPYFSHSVSLAPYANAVAYITRDLYGDEVRNERLHYFDYVTRKELWVVDGRYFSVVHNFDGTQLIAANAATRQVEVLDVKTGAIIRSFPTHFENFMMDSEFSPSGEYLFFTGFTSGSFLYHIPTGKLVNSFSEDEKGFSRGVFVNDRIFAFTESSALKFYDLQANKELLRIYVFEDHNWIALTPEGLFEGSPDAWDKVTFVKGKEVVPLESVFNQFYTPRLIYKVLAEKEFKLVASLANIKEPPSVMLKYLDGTRNLTVEDDVDVKELETENETANLSVEGKANGDQIVELRLYQNGKLVGNKNRNLLVEDDVTPNGNSKEYSVTLIEGVNEFLAIAINSQGTESRPEKLVLHYKPSQSLIKPQGIQAHLLVIGIDEYQNAKYNLNYAVADAKGFQESVQAGLAPITSKTHVYFIKNGEAVRSNILSKLNEIATVANPQDIFIFYYAGHGVMGENSEFYLVPNDVTQLYGDDGSLKQKGISASELKKIASGIAAQKQLYLLDACQSAGALATVAARGAVEEKAIAQLARSTGTHWLTASGSQQFATEFDELGHGVFTYVLLEALSGKADSGDKRVTVNELKAYLESRVPEISEKYKGSPQYPSSFGFGQDFPVSLNQN